MREKPTTEDLYVALADEDRRSVLTYLARSDPTTVEKLSSHLTERNGDERRVESVAIQLHHNHLPRLHDVGLLRYDFDDRTVETTERTAKFVSQLTSVVPNET